MNPHVLNIGAREYHADPHPHPPSLSASVAKVLLNKSPRHAWQVHPRLGGTPRAATPSMELGTLVHGILLGQKDTYIVLEYDSFRTKAAQEARDLVLAAHKAPVLRKDFDETMKACNAIRENVLDTTGVFLGSTRLKYEQVVVWGQLGAACRMMTDVVDGHKIYDLKTTRSAHPDDCRRAILEYGYDVQAAAYCSGWDSLQAEVVRGGWEAATFTFIFMEMTPPYAVTPVVLGADMMEGGRQKWAYACKTWAECVATNNWPLYAAGPVTVHGDPKPVWGSE